MNPLMHANLIVVWWLKSLSFGEKVTWTHGWIHNDVIKKPKVHRLEMNMDTSFEYDHTCLHEAWIWKFWRSSIRFKRRIKETWQTLRYDRNSLLLSQIVDLERIQKHLWCDRSDEHLSQNLMIIPRIVKLVYNLLH